MSALMVGLWLVLGSMTPAVAGKGNGGGSNGGGGKQAGTTKAAPAEQSGTQGKSPSDPDGDSNGGMDKPGESGGFDADKDGNNGCGNDTDREDDNNGWCGRKPANDNDVAAAGAGKSKGAKGGNGGEDGGAAVRNSAFSRFGEWHHEHAFKGNVPVSFSELGVAGGAAFGNATLRAMGTDGGAEVLGVSLTRAGANAAPATQAAAANRVNAAAAGNETAAGPASLARTGAGQVALLVAIGLLLMNLGGLALTSARPATVPVRSRR